MKPGYKQTDVGVIPVEWEVVTAAEACTLVVDCKNRTPPVIADSDFAVVRTPNVRDGKFVLQDLRFTDEVSYREWTARAVPQFGDIMITREAPLGEVCAVPAGRKVCLGQRMMLYRPATAKTNSTYLLYSLTSAPVRANLLRKIGGSTVGHAKVDDIRFLQLPLPPLSEQRAVAETLSDVDALLDAIERLITKKRDLKQAAMQQLLTGQIRLPGFQGEWEMTRLGEVAHIKTGSRNNEDKVADGIYPFFVRSEVVERIDSYSHDCEAILVPGEGRIGSIFHYIHGKFDAHQRVYAITQFKPDISGRFIHFYLSKHFGNWAMQNTVKATVDSLRLPTFLTFEMKVPSTLAEQTAIAQVLTDIDAELAGLEQRREKTVAIRHGMMQELLTGRTRLVAPTESHA
jgi:type I restriction enzyme S subunit